MTSQLPRVEGFEGHSLTMNKGEEVALLLPALHSTPRPPSLVKYLLSAFYQSLFWVVWGRRNVLQTVLGLKQLSV